MTTARVNGYNLSLRVTDSVLTIVTFEDGDRFTIRPKYPVTAHDNKSKIFTPLTQDLPSFQLKELHYVNFILM